MNNPPCRPASASFDRYKPLSRVNDLHRPACNSFTPRRSWVDLGMLNQLDAHDHGTGHTSHFFFAFRRPFFLPRSLGGIIAGGPFSIFTGIIRCSMFVHESAPKPRAKALPVASHCP